MKSLIKLFGVLMVLAGISLLTKPEVIFGLIENNKESTALYFVAILVRFAFGILFIRTAGAAKYPNAITFLGYFFIIAAIGLFLIGQENFQELINYLTPNAKPLAPLAGLGSIVFGGFLLAAFSANEQMEHQ